MSLGTYLKTKRIESGYETINALSKDSGVAWGSIDKLEKDCVKRPDFLTLALLSCYISIDLNEIAIILYEEEKP